MSDLLVLVHTVSPLLSVFDRLVAEKLPGVRLKHILDEPLLEAVRQRGGLAGADTERLQAHIRQAQAVGARAVLVTCSTISPLVDSLTEPALPVLKIDEAMLSAAVQQGGPGSVRIGVLATNPTTLEPTRQLLEAQAREAGKTIAVETRLVPGALEALLSGDAQAHDRLLAEAIAAFAPQVDVVVLAQASMARVLETLPASAFEKPLLSSPHLALERLAPIFNLSARE